MFANTNANIVNRTGLFGFTLRSVVCGAVDIMCATAARLTALGAGSQLSWLRYSYADHANLQHRLLDLALLCGLRPAMQPSGTTMLCFEPSTGTKRRERQIASANRR